MIDDNGAISVTDDTPNTEPRYRVRFYFDPNSIAMVSGDGHNLLLGYSGSATFTSVLRVGFQRSSSSRARRLFGLASMPLTSGPLMSWNVWPRVVSPERSQLLLVMSSILARARRMRCELDWEHFWEEWRELS